MTKRKLRGGFGRPGKGFNPRHKKQNIKTREVPVSSGRTNRFDRTGSLLKTRFLPAGFNCRGGGLKTGPWMMGLVKGIETSRSKQALAGWGGPTG